MTSAPAGIVLGVIARAAVRDAVAGGAFRGVVVAAAAAIAAASKGATAAGKLQVAALRARIVASDVASPGTRAAGVSGVLGGNGECDSVANEVAVLKVGVFWDAANT